MEHFNNPSPHIDPFRYSKVWVFWEKNLQTEMGLFSITGEYIINSL